MGKYDDVYAAIEWDLYEGGDIDTSGKPGSWAIKELRERLSERGLAYVPDLSLRVQYVADQLGTIRLQRPGIGKRGKWIRWVGPEPSYPRPFVDAAPRAKGADEGESPVDRRAEVGSAIDDLPLEERLNLIDRLTLSVRHTLRQMAAAMGR